MQVIDFIPNKKTKDIIKEGLRTARKIFSKSFTLKIEFRAKRKGQKKNLLRFFKL